MYIHTRATLLYNQNNMQSVTSLCVVVIACCLLEAIQCFKMEFDYSTSPLGYGINDTLSFVAPNLNFQVYENSATVVATVTPSLPALPSYATAYTGIGTAYIIQTRANAVSFFINVNTDKTVALLQYTYASRVDSTSQYFFNALACDVCGEAYKLMTNMPLCELNGGYMPTTPTHAYNGYPCALMSNHRYILSDLAPNTGYVIKFEAFTFLGTKKVYQFEFQTTSVITPTTLSPSTATPTTRAPTTITPTTTTLPTSNTTLIGATEEGASSPFSKTVMYAVSGSVGAVVLSAVAYYYVAKFHRLKSGGLTGDEALRKMVNDNDDDDN